MQRKAEGAREPHLHRKQQEVTPSVPGPSYYAGALAAMTSNAKEGIFRGLRISPSSIMDIGHRGARARQGQRPDLPQSAKAAAIPTMKAEAPKNHLDLSGSQLNL